MINWAIIGTGGVAKEFSQQFSNKAGKIYAVYSRSLERAKKFSDEIKSEKYYSDFNELLDDKLVDIVYIATPHITHYDYIKKALQKGKNVLAEKTIVLNVEQLSECIELAEKKNLFLAEGMTIHYMPLYLEIKDWISQKELGPLKMVQVNFGSYKDLDERYFFRKDLAGGALYDIGVYAINLVRFFFSSKPNEVKSLFNIHDRGVDESSTIILKNKEEELATISLTFRAKMPKRAIIAYEEGYIEIDDYPKADRAVLKKRDGSCEKLELPGGDLRFKFESEFIAKIIEKKQKNVFIEYTKDTIEIMDYLRKEWNLEFDL